MEAFVGMFIGLVICFALSYWTGRWVNTTKRNTSDNAEHFEPIASASAPQVAAVRFDGTPCPYRLDQDGEAGLSEADAIAKGAEAFGQHAKRLIAVRR